MTEKTVLVGVTGCIAAYKSCEIIRGLQKAGIRVKVVMTETATHFVGPATFKTLTREPVAIDLFDAPGDPVHHVSLAREADLMLIAPCTANVIAKVAHGIADDLLTTTVLALRETPLAIAPAMNTAMWEAQVTQENLATLAKRGVEVITPDSGYLACGEVGDGKLADVERIVERILELCGEHGTRDEAGTGRSPGADLAGRHVVVTAGPTFEPIDPVRFLGNRSSGKTGYAIASAAAARGAEVTLVSGPVSLPDPAGVSVVRVMTADEMLSATSDVFDDCDIAVFTAAVSDYRIAHPADRKIKRGRDGVPSLELEVNPDILSTLAHRPHECFVVGFAAETEDAVDNGLAKLDLKNADMIVANDVSGELGFGTDDNRVWFCTRDGVEELPVMGKDLLADRILDFCRERIDR